MALETFVKVSKVNNLSDARYCAGMGVDVIGFNLVPETPQFVSPEKFAEITEWLSGVEFAGEFQGLNGEEILKLASAYQLQFIQIEDPILVPALSGQAVPIILKFNLDKDEIDFKGLRDNLSQLQSQVSYFLFENEQEAYRKEVLDEILSLAKDYSVLLGYGISSKNVNELIHQSEIKGIALQGEEEIRAGYKDFDKLAEILELLEVDEFEG